MTLENNRAPLLYYTKLFASFQIHRWIQTEVTVWKRPVWVKFDDFWSRATLKFDRWPCKTKRFLLTHGELINPGSAPLLCYFKLCAAFHTHWWFQISVTVQKRSIRVKIDDFFYPRDLEILPSGWPSKTIGHLFYATSSFVYHFVPTGEFKLELQSGNAQFGSYSTIFRAVRPSNLTDDLEKQ